MGDQARHVDPMTFETAARLDPDSHAGEIEDGRFVAVTRNTWRHGEVLATIVFFLRLYAKDHPGWSISGGDPGTRLRRDPDSLRGPDVGVIRRERRPRGKGADGWLEGAPDLAVEIAGDAQTISELAKKALEYLAAGAKMVWVVDPEPRRVVVYTPPNAVSVLGPDDQLEGGDALPGFRCAVADLFE